MKRRLSATHWLLIVIGVLALTVGFERVARMVSPPTAGDEVERPADPKMEPDFKVGDAAPDFTLPDSKGTPHRLSEMVKRKTLLSFLCGCSNCRDVQTYLGILTKRLGKSAPDVVSVTTQSVDSEASWVRDTNLKQTLLYERKEGPIMKQYRGHPCPRVYLLNKDRTVAVIGRSPKDVVSTSQIGNEMAAMLGISPEGPGSGPQQPADR